MINWETGILETDMYQRKAREGKSKCEKKRNGKGLEEMGRKVRKMKTIREGN